MKLNFLSSTLIPFLFLTPLFAQAQTYIQKVDSIDLGENHALFISKLRKTTDYIPLLDIYVLEKQSRDTLYQEQNDSLSSGFIYDYSTYSLGKKEIAFLMHRSGEKTEVNGVTLVLILENGNVTPSYLETAGYFEFIDLDKDQNEEVLITDHLFYRLNVNACNNQTLPDPSHEGRLSPAIYQVVNNQLFPINEKAVDLYFESYVQHLEKGFAAVDSIISIPHYKDYSQPETPCLLDYAQYFLICRESKIGKKRALNFMRVHNKTFFYKCIEEYGVKFALDMNLFTFFQKFGKEIQEELTAN